ncbi:replication initiator protein [Dipodfec virus UOA04_Rod_542]|nr:replication initiator protein [Dipodfec virus UOA04_Rod_542]
MQLADIAEYAKINYGTSWPPDYYLEVPCGYCIGCQKSSNNQYRIRLLYEVRSHPPGSCLFLTLTFDDEHLTRFEKDPNKAVRLFLDRVRKRYGKQIRHWIIGEYGTLHGRVHYHGILFNVPEELSTVYEVEHPGDHPIIRELWSYGFVFVGYVSDKTCSYITKYLTKSINGKKVRPRIISSKGIGSSYLESDDARLHKGGSQLQPFMMLSGYPQALPRYYYNKIFTEVDKQNMILDRYLDPPLPSFQGASYSTLPEMKAARLKTHLENVRADLSPVKAPPTRRIKTSMSRFADRLNESDNYEFSLKSLTYDEVSNSF